MDKFIETDIYPDMRRFPAVGAEENQVAVSQIISIDTMSVSDLRDNGPREFGAVEFQEYFLDELTAVKAFGIT